jgi:hypothetical protein
MDARIAKTEDQLEHPLSKLNLLGGHIFLELNTELRAII